MLTEIISATVGGVCTALIIQGFKAAKFGGLKKVRIFEPRNGQFNSEFYSYFKKQIENAKNEIIVTGEGFEYQGKEGPAIADAYHSSMVTALRNNVEVTRIQTARPLHPDWAKKLKELVGKYPNFHLYILDNKEYQDIASVCVIDAEQKNNIVEFMLSAENDLGDTPVRLASTGMFLHGRHNLAKSLRDNTLAMKKFDIAKKCESEADIDEFLTNNTSQLYYSFGSNMSPTQMLKRCPSAEKIGVGVIPNYELVFNREGSYRPGGVASIVPSNDLGKNVYGVIWKISSKDLKALDEIEDPNAYKRVTIDVNLLHGETFACETYVAFPQKQHITPHPEYLKLILDGAKASSLPHEYIEFISKIETLGSNKLEHKNL